MSLQIAEFATPDSPTHNWENVRELFSLDFSYVHLALGMLTSHPLPVRQAIEQHRKGLDENPTLYYRNKEELEKLTLKKIALYLQCAPEEIAVTESTTMGLAVVLRGIALHEGDEILTTVHEHYTALQTLRCKAESDKVSIRHISLYEDAKSVTKEQILSRILSQISSNTRLVALTWVHSCSGVKLPIKDICREIAKCNATRSEKEAILVSVDGLHAFGVEDFNIHDLGCDYFIAGCHKWLFGPRGTGIVWASSRGWQKLVPIMTSFKWDAFWPWFNQKNPSDSCAKAWLCTPGGFQAFEHRWALGEAFELHRTIGKNAIANRVTELNRYCKEQMSAMPNITLHTPVCPDLSAGMICFDVKGKTPHEAVEALLLQKIVTGQTPYQKSVCRLTPGLLNNEQDLDRALEALRHL